PYILKIQTPEAILLYYGVAHTYNPADPQVSEIERLWAEFHPEIAFNEGGDPPIEKSPDDAVRKYGEPGLVRFLAARDRIPVMSIDPTRGEEVAFLRKKFSQEQVKLFYVLRVVAQHIKNRGVDTIDQELERVFPIFANMPGMNISPNSITELR